ncbi:chromatin-remodelling complex, RSC SWI/SNF subunit Rsc7/Swp82, partial [Diaporthe sp. PMI_573]
MRNHTSDQLGPAGDEYIPQKFDEDGEKKIMPDGRLLRNRKYRCRTFLVPSRGRNLFMLASMCAKDLGYRDSYSLFRKNRSLFKIVLNQVDKDDLVSQGILSLSSRSRPIAILTARSIFRQFGSRVVVNGRRVRDDYWEENARKQG